MPLHTLRLATTSDVEDLVSIDYDLFPDNNFNERTLHNQLEVGTGWLLYVDEKLAGYILCNGVGTPLVDILRLGVREPYRKVGIGTVLLRVVLDLGSDVMLSVRKGNDPAINLYLKHGFEITGTMSQHYSWVMRRSVKTTSS